MAKRHERAAKALVDNGWLIFPLAENTSVPLKGSNGHNDAKRSASHWESCPADNIGCPTGKKQGVVVLDIDMKGQDGLSALSFLQKELGKLPETFVVSTPSNGFHYYFNYPGIKEYEKVRNIAGRVGSYFCPGVDVRGDGGYVVLPPSRKPNGAYKIHHNRNIADLPAAWINELTVLKELESKVEWVARPEFIDESVVASYVDQIVSRMETAPQGTIRDACGLAAKKLTELVNSKLVTEHEAYSAWEAVAKDVLKKDKELVERWRSGSKAARGRGVDPTYLPPAVRRLLNIKLGDI
jgi:hypothetical protein